MVESTQEENASPTLMESANYLLKETKALQIVKSANMLIDLFGFNEAFERIKPKREGKQVEMQFPAIDNSITFTLTSNKEEFNCIFGKPENPAATIVINVGRDKILKVLSQILVLKDNLFGLMRLVPKLITRKLKIKGSLITAIVLCRCMMMGKHEMYKGVL